MLSSTYQCAGNYECRMSGHSVHQHAETGENRVEFQPGQTVLGSGLPPDNRCAEYSPVTNNGHCSFDVAPNNVFWAVAVTNGLAEASRKIAHSRM